MIISQERKIEFVVRMRDWGMGKIEGDLDEVFEAYRRVVLQRLQEHSHLEQIIKLKKEAKEKRSMILFLDAYKYFKKNISLSNHPSPFFAPEELLEYDRKFIELCKEFGDVLDKEKI